MRRRSRVGWFTEFLWRGDVADDHHARRVLGEKLGVDVERVEFRGLRTDEAYLDALKSAIAADLEPFKAESTAAVLSKYFGSSIQVTDDPTGSR